MIKIAYIATPIEFGGAEKVGINLLKNINRNVFDIVPILLIRPWEEKPLFEIEIEKANYQYLRIPVAIKPIENGRDYFRIIRCYKKLYKILKGSKFNLVHSNGYFADIIAMPICKMLKIPHIATCHGFIESDLKLSIYIKLDLFILKFINKIFSVSEELNKRIVSAGISKNKIEVLQNAVEMGDPISNGNRRIDGRKLLNIGNDEFVIGYVGRLSEEKGVRYLIEAISLLQEDGVKTSIIIIGEGPERDELEQIVKQRSIQNSVFFLGFLSDPEKWIPCFDVFVLPSFTEGTPMALLEAMSYGIPIIASAVGGIPKIIVSRKNGLLVSPGNASQIRGALQALYENEVLRKTLGSEARRTMVEDFNIKDWVNKIESVYSSLVN
jgi:glycosyltransferase involved in cell wall biosynthesis